MKDSIKLTTSTVAVKLDRYTKAGLDMLIQKRIEEGLIVTKSSLLREGLNKVFKDSGLSVSEIKKEAKKQL